MTLAQKAFSLSKLNQQHLLSYALLSQITPHSAEDHATALRITPIEASHRLSLLVDEGLAIANKDKDTNKPLGTYTAV